MRSNPVLCLINNMQAANNEGDVSGDDQAVQCFLVRLYEGTSFSPSPLKSGAGGGACPLPSTRIDRPFSYSRACGRFSMASGGCHRHERREGSGGRRGAERGAEGGGTARAGVRAAAKRRFWNLRDFGSMFGKFSGCPWSDLGRCTVSARERWGTGAFFGR